MAHGICPESFRSLRIGNALDDSLSFMLRVTLPGRNGLHAFRQSPYSSAVFIQPLDYFMTDAPHQTSARRTTPNRLASETSPYLLQHAFNPVNWFPWDSAALELATQLEKPIFLSIGYSACHWCHVMEHESFENDDIARLMNEHFVCIKVDREERPDLDQIYMTAVQMMTGRGGWPMSVFLTPNRQPFFGGTYWPPQSRMGMPGFRDILLSVNDAWKNRRGDVLRSANEMTDEIVRSTTEPLPRSELGLNTLRNAMQQFLRRVDWQHGGFGSAPKFLHSMDLRVLLRCWKRFGDENALNAVRLTLDKMANGGIYDQLGGGFHRYSTDERWLAPHFEKMLYDNALLVPVYLEAFQATGHTEYSRVVRETLDYVLREMTQPQGGFYSTQDADSEGKEGKFFVWTEAEILSLLGPEEGRVFCDAYDVSPGGNWEGHNILNRPNVPAQAGAGHVENMPQEVLSRCRAKLFEARSHRIAPGRDDKVLVNWNGLMIAAMSQAANILNEPRYAEAAQAAAHFIRSTMHDGDGRLLRTFKDGQARIIANLDDYACLIDGLIDLYQATFDPTSVEFAIELAEQMLARFEDSRDGSFFFTAADAESLITRHKDTQDNATPSGSGMAAYALVRLGTLTGRSNLLNKAQQTLETMSGQLMKFAMASGQALMACDFVLGSPNQIVIATGHLNDTRRDAASALQSLHQIFLPNKVVIQLGQQTPQQPHSQWLEDITSGKQHNESAISIFICQPTGCQPPIHGLLAWTKWLESQANFRERSMAK